MFLRRNERRLLIVVVSSLLLTTCLVPFSPMIGHSLKQEVCNSLGECEAYIKLLASCAEEDNTQLLARERRTVYVGGVAPERLSLAFYANKEASVVSGDGRTFERFRFYQSDEALKWLVGRDPSERAAVNASQGPAPSDFSEGLAVWLHRLGLSRAEQYEPASEIEVAQLPNGKFAVEAFNARNEAVKYRATQAVDRPEDNIDGLSRFYTWLGLQAPFLVQVDFDKQFEPVSVSLVGYARDHWSERELGNRTLGLSRLKHVSGSITNEFVIRSYELDLQSEQNREAFNEVATGWPGRQTGTKKLLQQKFESVPSGQKNNYQRFGERIIRDGKLVDSVYRVSRAVADPFELLLGIEAQIPGSLSDEPTLKDASVRDFSRPETGHQRLVNCDGGGQ